MHKTIIFLMLICSLYATKTFAISLTLKSLETNNQNSDYIIDARFSISLSEEIMEALKNGIPLTLQTDVEVLLLRDWLPDEKTVTLSKRYQLQHQPLTEDYLTVDLKTGIRQSYDNLNAALNHIGQINNFKLLNQDILLDNRNYMGRIRMYLDLDSLPTPMRPQVYFSDDWLLETDWYKWKIK